MRKQTREIIENLGWCVNSDTSIEMWTDTAGQNYCIECNEKGKLKETIKDYSENYDIDYEVELYLQAKQNGLQGVPTARTLVKDCEEVERRLEELWEAVKDLPKF